MTLTQRAMLHNPSAFLAELREVASIRRLHNDHGAALDIERSVIALETGETVDTEWTNNIAKRFIHGIS